MSEIVDRPEGMAEFFDARVEGYEAHMREVVSSFADFYQGIPLVLRPRTRKGFLHSGRRMRGVLPPTTKS